MLGLWNIAWLNQNSQRAYPIAEHGSRRSFISSDVRIPDDFLLALKISVNTGHNVSVEDFFIKSLTLTPAGCAILIGYNDGATYSSPDKYPSAASVYICTSEPQMTYTLSGLGEFSDLTGYVAVNPQCSWLREVAGYFTFEPGSTPIEPDCIVPMLKSVSSIAVSDGYSVSDKCYGDIVLTAGSNIEMDVEDSETYTKITIHAVSTSNFTESCSCDLHEDAPCIRSINSVRPDTSGNIVMEGTGCLSISNGDHKITLSDTCASPRCGCDTLQDLATEIRGLEDGVATLENFINRLGVNVAQAEALIGYYTAQTRETANEE